MARRGGPGTGPPVGPLGRNGRRGGRRARRRRLVPVPYPRPGNLPARRGDHRRGDAVRQTRRGEPARPATHGGVRAPAVRRTQCRGAVRGARVQRSGATLRIGPAQRSRGRFARPVLRRQVLRPAEPGVHGTARQTHRPAVPPHRPWRHRHRRPHRLRGFPGRHDDARGRAGVASDPRARGGPRIGAHVSRGFRGVYRLPQGRRGVSAG